MKFKVGDKVKFIKKGQCWSDQCCSIGEIYQIIRLNDSDLNIRIDIGNGKGLNVDSSYFELVQEDKLPQSQTKKLSKPIRSCEHNGSIYKEDTIDGVSIEEMKATRDDINSKLLTHRNLFFNNKKK